MIFYFVVVEVICTFVFSVILYSKTGSQMRMGAYGVIPIEKRHIED